jgi:ribonuclease HI
VDASRLVVIYTDGGCDPNPGPGGWGAVLVYGGRTKEISGAELATTNNRMELTAAIEALRLLTRPCLITLYTDSQYLKQGVTSWLKGWVARGWQRAGGGAVQNQDLWQALQAELGRHEVAWQWVRGHTGEPLNERADALARQARHRLLAERRKGAKAGRRADVAAAAPEPEPDEPIHVYARACALGVPGPAGYAAVLRSASGHEREVAGRWPSATANVMELWAVIAALRTLERPTSVVIHTGSKYVLDGATRWLAQWERHGFHKRDGSDVKNVEVWRELGKVLGDHDVTWVHATPEDGEPSARAALRARQEAEKARP